ncbi:glucuronide transporter:cation symporter [Modestobacter italicus]|uniref:Glucuronide transporter:cation symporter n=1 Tax=Modestobacter italicus (strain DSM 44449 / CECT 9708 / BC 501) TaxID=2732864 RepID=I4EYL2_MODI5|nr:cytidylate kinase family protein [Modestobacter marinus]CCH88475.1 glucuronide transporter:cation symporter [Modestobacter marinus]
MVSDSTRTSADERLPRSRVVGYSLGDVANNVSFMMTSLFLMAYMTDIAGVPAAIAGIIYGVTKIWAGVTDLIAGNTVGRRETKWGRLRPWLIWVSPFLAISLVLLFSTPAGLGPTATIAWVLLFDAAFQLCYSFVNIPYGSLSAAMTENGTDRSRLSGARSIASSMTGVVLSLVLSPQFEDTTADDIRLRFTTATIILAVIALVLYWLCFRSTREVVPAGAGELTLKTTLQMVRRNKPLLVLCLGALFLLGASFTMNAVMLYYARDVLGSATSFTWLYLCQTIGTIAVASLIPAITERVGKRVGYVALAAVGVVGFVLIALTPTGDLLVALLAFLVFGAGFGGTNALMFSMQADTVDYGEWRTGTRAEGGSYSILSFVRKVGQGVGGFLGGAVIGAFGYTAGAQVQSPEAIQGIKIAAGWVPAALCVIAAVALWFYPLTNDEHREIVRELNDRRARHAFGEATAAGGAVSVADGEFVVAGPVITINEQYGAGASYVAARVAERLGVPYAGTRFSSEQLEQAEATQPAAASAAVTGSSAAAFGSGGMLGFLRSFSRTTTEGDASVSADALSDSRLIQQNVADVIDMVRDSGGVVVGRDATVILSEMQGALHVRLEAPLRTRVSRAAEAYGVSTEVAAQRQAREDRMRVLMSDRLMHWDPTDASRYDLVIDTSEISLDDAVDMIVAASEAKRAS